MPAETLTRERPILFSGEMVRAILDGRKTMTRRVVKAPGYANQVRPAQGTEAPRGSFVFFWREPGGEEEEGTWIRCPYGRPGDRLWVRETWAETYDAARDEEVLWYRADGQDCYRAECGHIGETPRWRPSIHMPRWASRITLEITDVRVERVQEISNADAFREGVGDAALRWNAQHEFRTLWDSLNRPRGYGWDANPWVFVISFRRIEEADHAR